MIYSRFGEEVRVVRQAVEADVRMLESRKANKHDRGRIEDGCYLVTDSIAHPGRLQLADVAFLRADGGLREISDAVGAVMHTPLIDVPSRAVRKGGAA